MGWHQIKIRPADTLFSRLIRTRARKCEFGIKCSPKERYNEKGELDISYMDNVHTFTRRKESTRFDEQNCHAGCKACHKWFHERPKVLIKWSIKKYGEQGHSLLEIRSNTPLGMRKEYQDDMVKIYCKQELKKLNEKEATCQR